MSISTTIYDCLTGKARHEQLSSPDASGDLVLPPCSPLDGTTLGTSMTEETKESLRENGLFSKDGRLDLEAYAKLPPVGHTYDPIGKAGPLGDMRKVPDPTTYPYRWVCYLSIQGQDGGWGRGTAFMIARRSAGTVAHAICGDGKWAKTVLISVYNAQNKLETFQATCLTVLKAWTDKNFVPGYDWGLIDFGVPVADLTGYFGLLHERDKMIGRTAQVTGFPYMVKKQPTTDMWTADAKIIPNPGFPFTNTYYFNLSDAPIEGGSSGSPVHWGDWNAVKNAHVTGIVSGSGIPYGLAYSVDNGFCIGVNERRVKEKIEEEV